jgi:hypothetical protein
MKTGDGWWEGRRRPGGMAGGRRNSGGTPGPLGWWNPSVLLSGRKQGTKKRPRRDLTGAAFCGMLWATSAPLWPAWRVALCRCRDHRRGRFYFGKVQSQYTPKGAICQTRPDRDSAICLLLPRSSAFPLLCALLPATCDLLPATVPPTSPAPSPHPDAGSGPWWTNWRAPASSAASPGRPRSARSAWQARPLCRAHRNPVAHLGPNPDARRDAGQRRRCRSGVFAAHREVRRGDGHLAAG